jgi:NADH:ubiquinone oxidoreductase subunit C
MTSFNKNLFFISIYIYFLNKSELFIFDLTSSTQSLSTYKNKFKQNLNSGESLFFNLNWLEREMAELLGMVYRFKNDIRNLLLMYGDIIMPLLKAFPSVGFIEFIYSL